MNPVEKNPLFEKLENYYSINNDKYGKMAIYYKKNRIDYEYINFYELSQSEYLNRTNNFMESFHAQLNSSLDCYIFFNR